MKKQKTIWLKQLSAAMLLLLMLFITGVKLLHTHSSKASTVAYETKQSTYSHQHIANESHCDICDYQIAKETSEHSFNVQIHTPINFIIFSLAKKQYYFYIQSYTSDSRAPPSLI